MVRTLAVSRLRELMDRRFAIGWMLPLLLASTGCGELMKLRTREVPASLRATSSLVTQQADGSLHYASNERGDHVPDFSNVGYEGGGVELPNVAVRARLRPGSGDDTARIQRAVDEVATRNAGERGFRGAVLLRKGKYQVSGTLNIHTSGIVLRGEGQGDDGTVIVATGTEKRTLIEVGDATARPKLLNDTRRDITDSYVPVGAREFTVENTSPFRLGDEIIVYRPSTKEWISALGMDRIAPREDGTEIKQWTPGSRDLRFKRVITAIQGKRITVDAPLTNSLDRSYGGGYIVKYDFPRRIDHIGIENLRLVSAYRSPTDEKHAWTGIGINAVKHAWVRDVTSFYFGFGLVHIRREASRVTVQDSRCLDPVSLIRGDRRYPYYITGQLSLVQRCEAREGRHDFANDSVVPGPNVFLDCTGINSHADTGPHHRWATGTLFDNVVVRDDRIRVRNAGNTGSGHGWTGANMVLWNCQAEEIVIENPPTAQNWAIGCVAEDREGDGVWDQYWRPVRPRSLYLAQLEARLGEAALRAIGAMQ